MFASIDAVFVSENGTARSRGSNANKRAVRVRGRALAATTMTRSTAEAALERVAVVVVVDRFAAMTLGRFKAIGAWGRGQRTAVQKHRKSR